MKTLKISFALMGVTALLLPMLVLAATGTRTYEGRGRVKGVGVGGVRFEGTGKLKVAGTGTLTVSDNAKVEITGEGEKSVDGDTVTYTSFDGKAVVSGTDVVGNLSGDVKSFETSGKGKVTVEGDGKVSARAWFLTISGWKSLFSKSS
ncbi:MAG: hypothetical protein HYV34_03590 [Candidatus Kerfeldbacteria bacterium]|nr:hypothetical protein [Candidatus Kerfeldbacteria bacterium]